ncbi:MAG TPA: DUF1573 domain-containing protein [Thermoanaerobaculia bacterium]
MNDDWQTVNYKPGKGGVIRDIDLLRKRYSDHRAALERLAADAPTEHLARRYRDVIAEVDAAVAKLDALEGERSHAAAAPVPPREAGTPFRSPEPRPSRSWADAPLYEQVETETPQPHRRAGGGRAILILVAGLFMIVVLALLFRSWLRGDEAETPVVRPETTLTETTAPPVAEAEPDLAIAPETQDYGTIRRGARAARQFEVQNQTDATLPIEVRRSACRCLWFEYADTIPARGTTTLTVTVDASKVAAGRLNETVEVATKSDPPVVATFTVTADIANGGAR